MKERNRLDYYGYTLLRVNVPIVFVDSLMGFCGGNGMSCLNSYKCCFRLTIHMEPEWL